VSNSLAVQETEIPGLFVVNLVLHGDERGWFKENYQQAKMEGLGLPHFDVVQNNFSYNAEKGASRGLHAEPWEKFVSLANGRVFGAWTDLRKGSSFGKTFSIEITPEVAIFVPRGVANGYQTLEENVTYTYLVNAHWSLDVKYSAVNMFDPELGLSWPISQTDAIVSNKDKENPDLKDIVPLEY
jgi:dTDP-4-dehydrorhamnose 3,5-epimerase